VDICNEFRNQAGVTEVIEDSCVAKRLVGSSFSVDICDRTDATVKEQNMANAVIKCYTDGSKLESGAAGAGVIIIDDESREEVSLYLGSDATVFQTEITALATAADLLLQRETSGRMVVLFTDSQAAIRALDRHCTSYRTVLNCWEKLTELGRRNQVSVEWIPGHVGVQGNEDADGAAKKGATSRTFGPEPFLPLPECLRKRQIREFSAQLHRERWLATSEYRQTREAVGWADPRLTEKLLNLSKTSINQVIQIITGHANLARHRFICRKAREEICPYCFLEPETPNHHVGECLYFEVDRRLCFGVRSTSVNTELRKGNVALLAKYLSTTGRLAEFH
jgi:ribonuclease HI